MICFLNFLETTIRFDVADDAVPFFAPVHRFFRHLVSNRPARTPTFRIEVHGYDPDTDVPPQTWQTEQSVIRRSSAAEFNFDAHIVDQGNRRWYINRATLLDAPVDAVADNLFRVRLTAKSTIQIIDFVRDLVIRHQENRGTVVLHASGFRNDEKAVIVAGSKGAGKTTTLLSALRHSGWSYFTGDKVFCRQTGDGITVYPWRDYPYVGVGTIRADRRLEELVRQNVDPLLDEHPPTHKLLIDPDVFESWLGTEFSADPMPLSAILLPEVRPGEPMRSWRLTGEAERWAHLNKIVDRQVDTSFFTWQSYLVPDYSAFYRSLARLRQVLPTVEMIRLRGTLDVDPDALLLAHTGSPQPIR